MIGKIRSFLPAAQRGILQTDSGDELPFSVPPGITEDLQGGDIVEFELGHDGQPAVLNVTLRSRWATLLNEEHRPLVNQFHDTIRIHA